MDISGSDPFNGGSSTASLEEIGSEDDLFSTYIDVKKLGGNGGGNFVDHYGNGGCEGGAAGSEGEKTSKPRHRHSVSVDGTTSSSSMFGEIMEAKKAMPPDKLAELWSSDPKRAKRFFFFPFLLSNSFAFEFRSISVRLFLYVCLLWLDCRHLLCF